MGEVTFSVECTRANDVGQAAQINTRLFQRCEQRVWSVPHPPTVIKVGSGGTVGLDEYVVASIQPIMFGGFCEELLTLNVVVCCVTV